MCSLVGFCLYNKYLIIVASRNLNSLVHNSPKAINNRIFKTEFKYEEYLNILEIKDATLFAYQLYVLPSNLISIGYRPSSLYTL
jgi:hypothetical protein